MLLTANEFGMTLVNLVSLAIVWGSKILVILSLSSSHASKFLRTTNFAELANLNISIGYIMINGPTFNFSLIFFSP